MAESAEYRTTISALPDGNIVVEREARMSDGRWLPTLEGRYLAHDAVRALKFVRLRDTEERNG